MLGYNSDKYFENNIKTASPAQLLLMLYDGAIRFLKIAIDSTNKHDFANANKHYQKTQNIIQEFIITIDKNAPIAKQLVPLYDYFYRQLVQANIHKDVAPAEEVLSYLVELRETWYQASRQSPVRLVPKNDQYHG